MHPPWQGGVGYCFARYDAIDPTPQWEPGPLHIVGDDAPQKLSLTRDHRVELRGTIPAKGRVPILIETP